MKIAPRDVVLTECKREQSLPVRLLSQYNHNSLFSFKNKNETYVIQVILGLHFATALNILDFDTNYKCQNVSRHNGSSMKRNSLQVSRQLVDI